MALDGWIKLHRKILDCEIWISDDDEPFDRRSAWIDLLLLANHRDKRIIFDREPMIVKRGQFITSVRRLASRWMWDKDKVLRYLRLLENLNMIERLCDTKKTVISIVNYEIYQQSDLSFCDTDSDTDTPTEQTRTRHETATTKNIKNDKNDKNLLNISPNNNRATFKPPSVEEVRAYCSERNNGIDADSFVNFYSSKGWMIGKNKMKDWKAAVRTWEKNRKGSTYGNYIGKGNGSINSESEISDAEERGYLQIEAGVSLSDLQRKWMGNIQG